MAETPPKSKFPDASQDQADLCTDNHLKAARAVLLLFSLFYGEANGGKRSDVTLARDHTISEEVGLSSQPREATASTKGPIILKDVSL